MKKLNIILIILVLAFVSCNDDSISAREKRETKQNKKQVKTETGTVYYEPAIHSINGNSYWFVVVESKKNGRKMNGIFEQNHKYFSTKEAKAAFNENVFILNFVQVSKETFDNQ